MFLRKIAIFLAKCIVAFNIVVTFLFKFLIF